MTYATKTQADTYHQARLSAEAWSAIPDEQQAQALQSATDSLDAYALSHGGWREEWTADNLPEALINACCELAAALTDKTLQERISAQRQGVASLSIGSASETYNGQGAACQTAISPAITIRLRPLLKRAGSGTVIL